MKNDTTRLCITLYHNSNTPDTFSLDTEPATCLYEVPTNQLENAKTAVQAAFDRWNSPDSSDCFESYIESEFRHSNIPFDAKACECINFGI